MRRRSLFAVLAALSATAMMGATVSQAATPDRENTIYLDLKDGRVVIQLLPEIAPKHVERVKELARKGFYDGTPFHRVIEGFMAQGGDPTGTGNGGSELANLPAEFTDRPQLPARHGGRGPDRRPEQRQQPVLHHVRAGAEPGRAVHDLGPGDLGNGVRRQDQARQRGQRHGAAIRTGSCISAWLPTSSSGVFRLTRPAPCR